MCTGADLYLCLLGHLDVKDCVYAGELSFLFWCTWATCWFKLILINLGSRGALMDYFIMLSELAQFIFIFEVYYLIIVSNLFLDIHYILLNILNEIDQNALIQQPNLLKNIYITTNLEVGLGYRI
jgi:hypothetical protein